MLSQLKGYRTVIVNVVVAVMGILVAFGVIPAAESVSPEVVGTNVDAFIGAIATIFGIVNVILRVFTNTPVGSKS